MKRIQLEKRYILYSVFRFDNASCIRTSTRFYFISHLKGRRYCFIRQDFPSKTDSQVSPWRSCSPSSNVVWCWKLYVTPPIHVPILRCICRDIFRLAFLFCPRIRRNPQRYLHRRSIQDWWRPNYAVRACGLSWKGPRRKCSWPAEKWMTATMCVNEESKWDGGGE